MSRLENLEKLKAKKGMVIFSDGEKLLETLDSQFNAIKELAERKIDLDLDDLIDGLKDVTALKDTVSELQTALKGLKFPEIPDSIDVKGLEALSKIIKSSQNKPQVIEKLDAKPLTKVSEHLENLIKSIEKIKIPEQGQTPGDFVPMRRVMKLDGIGLAFDDSHYVGGGGGGAGVAPPDMLYQPISQGGAGTDNLVGARAGKRIKVTNYVVVMGGAGTLQFTSDANAITGAMSFGANGGVSVGGTEFSPAFQTGVGEALNMVTTSAAGNGHIAYFFE